MIENILGFLIMILKDMFDEIMSVLTTANPNDMSSQASDLANLLGFNDFNNKFDDNLAFRCYRQSKKQTPSKCRCGKVRKTC